MKTALHLLGLLVLAVLCLPLPDGNTSVAAEGATEVTFAFGELVRAYLPPLGAVLALSLLACAAAGPAGSTRRALRALIGLASEDEHVPAATTLAYLARLAQGIGLTLSLVAAVSTHVIVRQVLGDPDSMPSPANVAGLLTWSILPASIGLAAARMWLAPRADALFARAGEARRTFTPGEDFGLFAMIVPVLINLVPLFLKADTL